MQPRQQDQPPTPSLDSIRVWKIHIGAHKTATTHLQHTLAAVRERLRDHGVDYIPLKDLREARLAEIVRRAARSPDWLLWLRARSTGKRIYQTIAPFWRGRPAVLLSEENLLGRSAHALEHTLYRDSERVVRVLSGLSTSAEITFFLTLRSLDALLPSAYAQHLRSGPPRGNGFEAIRSRALAAPPSWYDLVTRIREAAPNISLRVWRYEDYSEHRAAIVRNLCACDPGPLPDLPAPSRTRSPSAAAVAAVEALPRDLPKRAWRARVFEIFDSVGSDEPRFNPFSEEERQRLRVAYEQDLVKIAALDPNILMRFDPVSSPR